MTTLILPTPRAILRVMVLLASLMLGLAASGRADPAVPWQNWQTSLQAEDPLVGMIWSTRESRLVTPYWLADALAEAKFVLIGETHDNADHHRLQAWLIDQIATKRNPGRKPAVVMEMISLEQSTTLEAYLAKPDASAAGLGPALDWATSGWPDWPLYQPIAEAVFRAGLPLLPGDPSRPTIRSIASRGLDFIDPAEQRRLALDQPLAPALGEALNQDIKQSHCDLLPEAAIGPMTQVQRYRDAVQAGALVKAGKDGGSILIAGNGHVRSDRGVPWYLVRQDVGSTLATVMLLEIADGATTIEDLAITGPDGDPAADYIWVTPRADREDQCESLRRHFEK